MLSYMPWLARAVEGGELRSITLGHPLLDVFSGDLPRLDDPLPRFLDDGAAMKLLQAARSDEDPLCAWADAEGAEMLKLRRETHQRMLGNGYCARPVELYCHFESICESCTSS